MTRIASPARTGAPGTYQFMGGILVLYCPQCGRPIPIDQTEIAEGKHPKVIECVNRKCDLASDFSFKDYVTTAMGSGKS